MNIQSYVTLDGKTIAVDGFDSEERQILDEVVAFFLQDADWNDFANFWHSKVISLYDRRGIERRETIRKDLYQIAQDMEGRLGVKQGKVAWNEGDYRDELADLIRSQFGTCRAFCQATGLSQDMLSHVLARRKHLSIESLSQVLDTIGYCLKIVEKKVFAEPFPTRLEAAGQDAVPPRETRDFLGEAKADADAGRTVPASEFVQSVGQKKKRKRA